MGLIKWKRVSFGTSRFHLESFWVLKNQWFKNDASTT